jgi:hypothetical protein
MLDTPIPDRTTASERKEPHMATAYPAPTIDQPDFEELQEQTNDGIVDTTDGCQAEPDGTCEHGHPSWLLRLGFI